jgi:hypothetical protein
MAATKLSILHGGDQDPNCRIVGVLEQLAPGEATKDRPLALVRILSFFMNLVARIRREGA